MELIINIRGDALEEIEVMAEVFGLQVSSMIEHCLDLGVSIAIVSELSKRKQEKKERSKERKEQKKININIYTSLEGGMGETFLACPENDGKKKRRTTIPKSWVDSADAGHMPSEDEIDLCRLAKRHNFYTAAAREMFISFANYHATKGSRYKDWKRTWTMWITHQKKYNPDKMGKKSDSVIRSYETKNPLEGIFND